MAFQLLSESNCALLKLNDRNSSPIFVRDNSLHHKLMEILKQNAYVIFIILKHDQCEF